MTNDEFQKYLVVNAEIALGCLSGKLLHMKKDVWDRRYLLKELMAVVMIRCISKTQFWRIHTEGQVRAVILRQAEDVFAEFSNGRQERIQYVANLNLDYRKCQEDIIHGIEEKDLFSFLRNNLPQFEFELFYLKVIENYKYKVLVKHFGKSVDVLKKQLAQVKKRISELISKENA